MNKVYQYRKFIQWGQYIFPAVCAIFAAFWAFMGVALYSLRSMSTRSSSPFQSGILVTTLCTAIIFVIEGIVIWYLYYRLAGVRVIFEDDSLIYKHRTGEMKIYFTGITKIGLPSIPYVGGWITINAGKEKIRLTVAIEEMADFVQTLKASLDKNGLANRYEEAKLFGFLKTAVFADQSWDRIYVIFWKFILAIIIYILLGIGIATISNYIGGILWILFSFVYPTLVYGCTEFVFARHIARTAVRDQFFSPARDIAYENSVYRVAIIISSVIYFILALVMIFI